LHVIATKHRWRDIVLALLLPAEGRAGRRAAQAGRGAEGENRIVRPSTADLHANVHVAANNRGGLEHLARYVLRPPIAQERLTRTADGSVLLTLKAEWSDGTTHLLFEPIELLERLAALTPRRGLPVRQPGGMRDQHERSEVREVLEHVPMGAVGAPGPRRQRRRVVAIAEHLRDGQWRHIADPFPITSTQVRTALAANIARSVVMALVPRPRASRSRPPPGLPARG
jgi:Putative transposase